MADTHPGPVSRLETAEGPALVEKICEHIRAGGFTKGAAAAVGVSRDTVYAWLKRGRAETAGPYRALADAIDAARAGREQRLMLLIAKGAQKDWRAAAWLLERDERQKKATLELAKMRAELEHTRKRNNGTLPPDNVNVNVGAGSLLEQLQALRARRGAGPDAGGTGAPPAGGAGGAGPADRGGD